MWPLLSLITLMVIVAVGARLLSEGEQRIVTVGVVELVVVVGLYVFVGNSGIVSFGHIGFVAIGAYVSAFLTVPPIQKDFLLPGLPNAVASTAWPTTAALLAAAAAAALVAAAFGIALMRLGGLAAGIGTLAMLIVIYVVISHWESVTGGQTTLVGIPTDTTTTRAVLWAIVALVIAFIFQESRLGRRLRAASEDEIAAKSIGIGIVRERLAAFVLSAAIAGAGGALYGHFLGAISPDAFYFQLTFLTLTMLVVGGMRSLAGAVTGSLVITAVAEMLRRLEGGADLSVVKLAPHPGLREVGLAVVMLVILVYKPMGITGGREIHWPIGRWYPSDVGGNRQHDSRASSPTTSDLTGGA
jgi:branched-chain amino acid transport system permease protein